MPNLLPHLLQIGKQADVTVFVCRADYTPKSALNILNDLSAEGKLPNPCVILNGIDMSKRKYGYYYGYGRYGHLGRYGYGQHGHLGGGKPLRDGAHIERVRNDDAVIAHLAAQQAR